MEEETGESTLSILSFPPQSYSFRGILGTQFENIGLRELKSLSSLKIPLIEATEEYLASLLFSTTLS